MNNSLKGKRILITAGPTWVAIDDVRVISNISSGALGLLLAKQAKAERMKVDLILGPVGLINLPKEIQVFPYRYFSELRGRIEKRLAARNYDIILHAAAVSDFLVDRSRGKIPSKSQLILKLRQAPKLIRLVRRIAPRSLLVLFKLEVGGGDVVLINKALQAMKDSRADLAVANIYTSAGYKGYVLDPCCVLAKAGSRQELARDLFRVLEERFG
jgi:phosphopantothenoylcysteine synthetase/decarboxylase